MIKNKINLSSKMELFYYKNDEISEIEMANRLYIPNNYKKHNNLVIFLSGSGERGSDGISHIRGNANIINKIIENPKYNQNTFILAPQVPHDMRWFKVDEIKSATYTFNKVEESKLVKLLLDLFENYIPNKYNVVFDNIYLVGLSMGGGGVWYLISKYPNKFSAAIPICAAVDPKMVDNLAKTPIWTFHSSDDNVVSYIPTAYTSLLLKEKNAPIKYTEYDDTGHASWFRAFEEKGLLEWLFSHKK